MGERFAIIASRSQDTERTLVPPDIAVCAECLSEMRDPADRRYGHPFITCTNCGPCYTVITDLPYDRPATTMTAFPMRRLRGGVPRPHGPPSPRANHRLPRLWTAAFLVPSRLGIRSRMDPVSAAAAGPISAAAAGIRDGQIVAVKGVGGYHLACRADDDTVVSRLRARKTRPAKPFAVMVADLAAARRIAVVDDAAATALTGPAAPIVLVRPPAGAPSRRGGPGLADLG